MKLLFLITVFLSPVLSHSQNMGLRLKLAPDIYLSGSVGEFNPFRHKIDTCIEGDEKYICRIDGNEVFGIDRGLDLPTTELFSLKIQINGKRIPLDISGMFNPSFDVSLSTGEFKLEKVRDVYFLQSYFSDGAGTYIAKWKISNHESKRILISNDEKHFQK